MISSDTIAIVAASISGLCALYTVVQNTQKKYHALRTSENGRYTHLIRSDGKQFLRFNYRSEHIKPGDMVDWNSDFIEKIYERTPPK